MANITFLRLLLIITFFDETEFPWWLWLYAIICELDHLGISFIKMIILTYKFKHISQEVNKTTEITSQINENSP